MTAHWINPNTFQRESASIALKRIKGSHTSSVLSKAIHDILQEFEIVSKIVKIVTDNGSNFVKALKPIPQTVDTEIDEDVEIINLTKILRDSSSTHCSIPLHQRCAAHTLNLCMTSDVKVALKQSVCNLDENENENQIDQDESVFQDNDFDGDVSNIDSAIAYYNLSKNTFKKCKSLWNKQSKSSVAADLIKEKLGVYLKVPSDTRWNSLLYASKHLLTFLKEKPAEIRSIYQKLKLDNLTTEELNFLEKYVAVSLYITYISYIKYI